MKSSVIRKDELGSEAAAMSEQLEVQVTRIESDVQYIAKVTTDLQTEQRRTNDRIDELRNDTNSRFDQLRDLIDSLKDKINSTVVWALLLYFALAGALLGVMAKGFKWI